MFPGPSCINVFLVMSKPGGGAVVQPVRPLY